MAESGNTSAIELTIEPRRRPVGTGTVDRLLPFRERRMVGPFIFLDRVGPEILAPAKGVDVDAHPHIGLATLTYLFDGRLRHRDSVGSDQLIEPGAVNWMTAGSGVSHTERSPEPERSGASDLHGLQIWVALPDEAQDRPPGFDHHPAGVVPAEAVAAEGGKVGEIEVIAGRGYDMVSPVAVRSELLLARLDLTGHSSLPVDGTHPERAVLAIGDGITIDDRPLPDGHLAVLGRGTRPRLRGPGTAMVLGGEPVGPRHIWWNFVHRDPEVIEEAKRAWTEQRFPTVTADHDVWVPLPD